MSAPGQVTGDEILSVLLNEGTFPVSYLLLAITVGDGFLVFCDRNRGYTPRVRRRRKPDEARRTFTH